MARAPAPAAARFCEAAADQAIAACGGDARETVKALLVAKDFLEAQVAKLQTSVSMGYARGRLDRKSEEMSEVTYDVALPFVGADDGIAPGEAVERFNPNSAVMKAEALSCKTAHVGALAFSRTGDPAISEFGEAKVIRKFGDVPGDLSAL